MRTTTNAQRYLKLVVPGRIHLEYSRLIINKSITAAYPRLTTLTITQVTKLAYRLVRYGDLLDVLDFLVNNYIASIKIDIKPTTFNSLVLYKTSLTATIIEFVSDVNNKVEDNVNQLFNGRHPQHNSTNTLTYLSYYKSLNDLFYRTEDWLGSTSKLKCLKGGRLLVTNRLQQQLVSQQFNLEKQLGASVAMLDLIIETM